MDVLILVGGCAMWFYAGYFAGRFHQLKICIKQLKGQSK